ncbi:Alpha-2-macroglobulin receptor-associated protein [Armadillidium vulgare]|nr:Alpha-2-macroglobulin receptor-associated protein [Armadillidium vulgare]
MPRRISKFQLPIFKIGQRENLMRMNLLSTMKIFKIFIFLIFCVAITQIYAYENKYSEDSNMEVLHLRDPLRMAKLNVIWEKARKRLSEPKLRKLLSELKVQDKEELTFKKLKASGGDKEGISISYSKYGTRVNLLKLHNHSKGIQTYKSIE